MFKVGDSIKNVNRECPHYESEGIVLNSNMTETEYMALNSGNSFKQYDVLKKSNDQLQATEDAEHSSEAWHTSKMYATTSQTDKLKNRMTVKFGKDADKQYQQTMAASKNNVDLVGKMHSPVYTGAEKQMLMKKLRTPTSDQNPLANNETEINQYNQQDELVNIFKEEIHMSENSTELKGLYEKYERLLNVHSYILTKENNSDVLKKQSVIENELESLEESIVEQIKSMSTTLTENKYGEGWMIKSQLYNIIKSAASLYHIVDEEEDFEDWIQYKITLAEDYILTAAKFIEFRKAQEGSFYGDDKSHYNEF